MSEAIVRSEDIQLAPSGAWLEPLLAIVSRKIRRALLSEQARNLIRLMEFTAGEIGGPLLLAQSLDELDARIDDALDDRRLVLSFQLGQASMPKELIEEDDSASTVAASMSDSLGSGCEELLHKGSILMVEMARAMRTVMQEEQAPVEIPSSPLHFLADPKVPSQVARCLVGGLRSSVCLLAMVQVTVTERRPAPWLMRAIIERWVDGLHQFMRLIASSPTLDIPASIIPLADRFNVEKLEDVAKQREEFFARVLSDPERAKSPVDEMDA